MRLLARLLLFGALLATINFVAYFVLRSNLANGIYPVDADSIGIPLAETWDLSLYGAVGLLVITGVTSVRFLYHKATASPAWRYVLVALFSLAYLCVIAFFALWGASWFVPHHYSIVAACWVTVIAIFSVGVLDIRRLHSNNSIKPTC